MQINDLVYGIHPTTFPVGGLYSIASIDMDTIADFANSPNYKNDMISTLTLNLNDSEEQILINYFTSLAIRNTNDSNALIKIGFPDTSANYYGRLTPKNLFNSLLDNPGVMINETINPKNLH